MRAAGREPVERDTLYNVVRTGPDETARGPGRSAHWEYRGSGSVIVGRARDACRAGFSCRSLRKISQARKGTAAMRQRCRHCFPFSPRTKSEHRPSASRSPTATSACPTMRWMPHRRGQAHARRAPRHPRPPLPARRSDQVRRLHRRFLKLAGRRRQSPTPSSSSSAASTSWPRAPTSCAGRTRRCCCRTSPPDARWPTWPRPISSRCAGASSAKWASEPSNGARRPGHLHQFLRGDQSVRRRARRNCLHLLQRRGHAEMGMGTRRKDSDPAGSAPWPQHRLQAGRAARSHGGVGFERGLGGAQCGPEQGRAQARGRGTALSTHASPSRQIDWRSRANNTRTGW